MTTTLFFATDIHGSTRCFKKFLNASKHYSADVLVLGGDVTGKAVIPIVLSSANRAVAYDTGDAVQLSGEAEITNFEERVANAGAYTLRCTPEEYRQLDALEARREQVFAELVEQRVREWVTLADERLHGSDVRVFFNTGNDDFFAVDPLIDASKSMVRPEGRCIEIDDCCTMVSTGFANETPFGCPRDVPEDELTTKIETMMQLVPDPTRCIFNFHCPPYGTQLDNAPKLDSSLRPQMNGFGIEYAHVGSTAVRSAIQRYQPLLGLHGHIHESKGAARIGKTLCLNPGSEYHEGVLRGALVRLRRGYVENYLLTSG